MNPTMSHNPRSERRRREPLATGRLSEANDTGINRTRRMKDLERDQPAAGCTGPGAGVNGVRGEEDLAVLIERSAGPGRVRGVLRRRRAGPSAW
jgi:hypothetical protein